MNPWIKWPLITIFGGGTIFIILNIFMFGLIKLNEEQLPPYIPVPIVILAEERDSVVTFQDIKLLIHFTDYLTHGTLEVKCNKPVYSAEEIRKIMEMDNVTKIEGAGINTEDILPNRRVCKIEYHFDRIQITKGICEIATQWKK